MASDSPARSLDEIDLSALRVRRAAAGRNGAALRAVHTCGSAGLCVRTCLRLCRCMCG